jgi:asparagine synthase (glutamine-hydrolysing)
MSIQLVHRGPDETGQHIEGSLGLGFRRLSIIDLEGSHQPMANEDGAVWIVFNGEIYNYQDLRSRLISRHLFNTSGDTETILHAYEDFSIHCVQHLRGMFAFAIWDRRSDQIMLAVDRFGKKPLYYLLDHEKCIFGSELKAILQHPNLTLEIDYEALDQYLAYGYIAAPYSIFQQIRKIPPGHTAVIRRDGSLQLESYWHPHLCPPNQYDNRSIDDLAVELRALLTEAVRIRMISDVPLGAFLSGGVDSSAVVALMSEVSDQPIKTFSIGFEEDRFDESSYAQLVADYCKTDHTCHVVRPDIINILPKLIHQYDEPFADSMIPTFYVSQATRQHVTVALSGMAVMKCSLAILAIAMRFVSISSRHLFHSHLPAAASGRMILHPRKSVLLEDGR